MTQPESSPDNGSESETPIYDSVVADLGDPEEMSREVDREIIRYLAAHP